MCKLIVIFLVTVFILVLFVQFWGFDFFVRHYGFMEQKAEIYQGRILWTNCPVLSPVVTPTTLFYRERSYLMSTDEDGLRTTACNALGGRNVVCLGDSEMFGYGADNEETFPSQLACLLNDKISQQYKVHNLGVSGYDTELEYLTLLQWFSTKGADWIVLGFNNNDNWNPMESIRPWEIDLFWLRFYFLARMLTIHIPDSEELLVRGYYRCLDYLKKIQDLCHKNGSTLIVYHMGRVPQILNGFPPSPDTFLDLSNTLTDTNRYRNPKEGGGFGHLSVEGHRVCAEAVAEIILARDGDRSHK